MPAQSALLERRKLSGAGAGGGVAFGRKPLEKQATSGRVGNSGRKRSDSGDGCGEAFAVAAGVGIDHVAASLGQWSRCGGGRKVIGRESIAGACAAAGAVAEAKPDQDWRRFFSSH